MVLDTLRDISFRVSGLLAVVLTLAVEFLVVYTFFWLMWDF